MADNTQIIDPERSTGTVGGDVIATDEIGGVKFQRVKLIHGADGVNDGDVSSANPLPVTVTDAGTVSTSNSHSTIVANGATWTGTGEDVSQYGSVTCTVKTDQAGTLYMEFSPDNANWDSSLPSSVAAGTNEVHRLSVTRQYFRARFTNSGGTQTYFRLQSILGNQPPLTSLLNSTVQTDADALVTRSVLMGQDDGGTYRNVPTTQEGHLEVEVHGPRLPFGALDMAELNPDFAADAVYGINTSIVRTTTDGTGGSATAASNLFTVSTGGTTLGYFGSIQSRRRLRYRPGQGSVCRFTALFSTPQANSTMVAGLGTAESGFYFGYNGTSFGVLHVTGGRREIQTLTVSVGAGGSETATVTLNGVATNVAVTSGSATSAAYQLSQATYNGWTAVQRGATVVFVANAAGNKAGAFTLTTSGGGTLSGSFVETLAGVASTDNWIAQADWNGDKLDGTGASGITLNPAYGNIYQIDVQYLGFGSVVMKVETQGDGNNPTWAVAHTFRFPNTRTSVSITQPSMPFTMAASNTGPTNPAGGTVSVSCGSFVGFVAGTKKLIGPRMSYWNTTAVTSSTSAYTPLFTVRNDLTFGGRPNQAVVNLISVGGVAKSNTGITSFFVIRNATLSAGTPNFTQYDATSVTYVDTAATACTFATNGQVVFTATVAGDGSFILPFADEITLQPGETVTLAIRSAAATATCIGQLNTREDQ